MSFEFLREFGGRRLGQAPDQPLMMGADGDEPEVDDRVDLALECPTDEWQPIDVTPFQPAPEEMPTRFIDGCYEGETLAWLQDREGHPIPLRLAQIGGVCIRSVGRTLGRETAILDRVVAMIADPFPWEAVESFATDLAAHGIRLLPVSPPKISEDRRAAVFDFQRMHEQTRNGVIPAMEALEEVALCHTMGVPTVVDGRLGRFRCDFDDWDVVGVIKRQQENYLDAAGWRVLYRLQPGERTPAFEVRSKETPVVSWYLKLAGDHHSLPNWGVVRVEYPLTRFQRLGREFAKINRISHALFQIRSRRASYSRTPVSMEPIVRAEESLKSLFAPLRPLCHHFYRVTNL